MLKRMILCALAAVLLSAACASAGEIPVLCVRIGDGDTVYNGRWNAMDVEIRNPGEALSGVLTLDLMQEWDRYDRWEVPLEVGKQETLSVHLPILALARQRTFEVSLRVGEQTVAQTVFTAARMVGRSTLIIGVPGENADSLAQALCLSAGGGAPGREETWFAAAIEPERFARSDEELSAYDMLAIDRFDVASLTQEQQDCLLRWLRGGGILLLGAGEEGENSLSWFSTSTGVRAQREALQDRGSDVLPALMDVVRAAPKETLAACPPACHLEADREDVLIEENGRCLLAQTEVGKGLVFTCAFSLSQPGMLEAVGGEALWQRLLLAAVPKRYNALLQSTQTPNTTLTGYEAVLEQRVSRGVGIAPVAALLAVYVLLVGTGLFALARRHGRTNALWAAIPACALVTVLLVAACAGALGLNQPAASSVRVTVMDEDGTARTQEMARVSYGDQSRVTLSTANGARLERRTNGYFSSYVDAGSLPELRDTVVLGEEPALAPAPAAPWTVRDLVVVGHDEPEGTIDAQAWIDGEGLHARITNGMEIALHDAVLLTGFGYARVGDLQPGESAQVSLVSRRADDSPEGTLRIPEGVLLPYTVNTYRLTEACVYPESEEDSTFSAQTLDAQEQEARALRLSLLRQAETAQDGQLIPCTLVAMTPELPCTALVCNGEPVTRQACSSMIIRRMALEAEGADGSYLYPQGVFPARETVTDEDGQLVALGEGLQNSYIDTTRMRTIGFDLSGLNSAGIDSVRIVMEDWRWNTGIGLEAFDASQGAWVRLAGGECVELTGEALSNTLGEEGTLYLRFSHLESSERGYGSVIDVPEIVVEGRNAL